MTESLLLAALGSVAALFLGRIAAVILLRIMGAPSTPRIATDWRIVLSAAVLALGVTLAFGLAPALQAVRRGPSATRARRILVAIQVAASCVRLILSTFFTRVIQQSFHTDLTFDSAGLAVVDPGFYLRHDSPAQSRQAAQEIVARLKQLPGVDSASIVTVPPFRGTRIEHFPAISFT